MKIAVKAGINQASVSAALRGQENFGPDRIAKLTRAIVELGLMEPVTPGPNEPTFQIPVDESSE